MTYKYTQTWFLNSELKNRIFEFLNPVVVNHILEIGCYEGLSSVFFADNFIHHPDSTLTCVDPFLHVEDNDHKELLKTNEEANFDYNLSVCQNSNKITIHKVTSDEFFKCNTRKYNFIYIDGCHIPSFIARDMVNAFAVLQDGGIMWMDDYKGGDGIQIKSTMDKFLLDHEGLYEVIHMGYQLAIRKKV